MTRRSLGTFGFSLTLLMMPVLSNAQGVVAPASENRITILYDAFGKDASMRKDWGFSALVEVAGKRILFDTGDNRDIFAANVKAKNVDLTKLDFVVLSHRHGDHMAGLAHVLSVNPRVKIYAPRRVSASTAHRCRRASTARLRHCRRTCATLMASHPR
jgi:7,8-dihydropterin-6-yl-methyl-4-(beta-D-ribofuranosyl)aminobenzene 5'-phosphate synthase